MTQLFDVISLNNHLYVVDKEVEIQAGEYAYTPSDGRIIKVTYPNRDYYYKIIASTDPSLKLPMLPTVEREKSLELRIVELMKNILVKGQQFELAAIFRDAHRELDVNPTPKQVELEMLQETCEKCNGLGGSRCDCEKGSVYDNLKLIDNQVIVKRWIYEKK